MLQEALQKIQREIGEHPNAAHIRKIGAFLIDYVRKNPNHAALFVAEGKSIKGSIHDLRQEAQKVQVEGVGSLDDDEAYEIVLKYFGVEVPKKAPEPVVVAGLTIDLEDLL